MAKIISLQKDGDLPSISLQEKEGIQELIKCTTEMNDLLILIEKSLENTLKYASKDINSRR